MDRAEEVSGGLVIAGRDSSELLELADEILDEMARFVHLSVEISRHILTPFKVEFARSSIRRGGAPTLVPVPHGGRQVLAHILGLNLSEQEAKDRLWRREVNKVGGVGHYVHTNNPGPNTLIIDRYENFEGIAVVLAARFSPTISPLNAKHLAELAIDSARRVGDGRDGITYLVEAKL